MNIDDMTLSIKNLDYLQANLQENVKKA